MLKKYIGDRQFYGRTFKVMLPILIQNVITNSVSLLDNVMVGRLGTEQVSGVAIINELIFVFNICVFGCLAGADIFSAQFFGKGDLEGVRNSFRMKIFFLLGNLTLFLSVFLLIPDKVISLYIHSGGEDIDIAATFNYAKSYLSIAVLQMVPFSIVQLYSGTLKSSGRTVVPMIAGGTAVLTNAFFNFVLIFGKLGFPELGVRGAAIATVIAKVIEMLIVVIWTHTHLDKAPYTRGLYRTLRVPGKLAMAVVKTAAPLFMNELLWSLGTTLQTQSFSTRGAEVMAAVSITFTVGDLFSCAEFALGNTISILIGQRLGAGELDKAVDEDRKLIFLAVSLCTAIALVMIGVSPFIPRVYNTTDGVKQMATVMLIICAVILPVDAFVMSCYFTLRSGGKSLFTMMFDSGFVCVVLVPVALILSRFTDMPILPLFGIVRGLAVLKGVMGFIFVKKRVWVNNLVSDQ